jgi:sugar O-acyltransferase (sialic acid O-acetyltransferase NeuD family)
MAELPPVVIWGASAEARVVAETLRRRGEYAIAGFVDDVSPDREGEAFGGSRILAGRDPLGALAARNLRAVAVAIGDNVARPRIVAQLTASGFSALQVRHPSAIVADDAVIGPASLLHAGAIVASGARLGSAVIVNTAASVDHGAVLGDGVHVAPGARIGGDVTIGAGTFVGMGAIVVSGCRVGQGVIVGAGALVLRDLPDDVVAYGAPAKVVRRRHPEDRP